MTTSPVLHELSDDFLHHPAETYRWLREQGPIHHVVMPSGMRSWLVTDYELARRAMTDPVLSKDGRGAHTLIEEQARAHGLRSTFGTDLSAHMLNSDPPDHDRLRKMVNRAFTLRAVDRMAPRIEQITRELLDSLEAGDPEVDLIDTFAYPLPITVISDVLGIPEVDRGEFRTWSTLIVSSSTADPAAVQEAANAMTAYLARLIADQREHPGDSMLATLVEAAEDGDRLSEAELISMVFLLLVAGHETTVNLIGNGTLALLRNPDQLALLRDDPALLPGAIEEFLRYEGPLNIATLRHTVAPWTVGEVTVPAGEFVTVALLAANNDPQRYPEPERLDITRRTSGHVAFGHGIHFCVGAPLARLEGAIAFRELLARFPDLTLAREPERLAWRGSSLMHGLVELPVRLR